MQAANFKFALDAGNVYGYFGSAGLQSLQFFDRDARPPALLHSTPNHVWGRTLGGLLDQYFSGGRVDFEGIPLDLVGATPFQQTVWQAARAIPHGQCHTYAELAQHIGRPKAARAVGNALGANPVCIVIPCHRILASGGALGGYSGGLHWKRLLLQLEGIPYREAVRQEK